MLCNPQNPVGRVWSKDELIKIGDICIKNDITIISDEIHCDFTFKGIKHTPIASISKELEDRTITLIAPSKTFNIAGLNTSVAIIPNEKLRNVYQKSIEALEIGASNIFGALGLEVAYNYGEQWLEQVLVYIESNVDYAVEINEALIKVGKVALNDGRPYGEVGDRFFRLNIGCPRSILADGLMRIEKAIRSLQNES